MESACQFCLIVAWLLCMIEVSTGTYISAGGSTHVSLWHYGDNEYRTWTVTTASNRRIRISFSRFDTESCCDHLRIVDTSTSREWSFSGSSRPADVVSTGNNIQLSFSSDGSVTAQGFSLYASSIPRPTPPVTSSLSLRDSSGTGLLGVVTVLEGPPFTFTCDVQDTSPAAEIRWYLDGALMETAYAPSRGEYSLVDTSDAWTLTPSRANHGQEVKCVASNTVSQEPYPYVRTTLDVNVLPSTIELWDSNDNTNNETYYLVAGEEHQFTCVVPGIKPGADFSWTLGGMELTANNSNDTTDANGLITSISVITLNPSWAYHGKNLRCLASNYDNFPGVNVSSTIDVKVPPTQSSLSIYDAEGTRLGQTVAVDQGTSYNFTCEVQGTRPAATIMWFIGDALQRTFIPPSGVGDDLVDTSDSLTFAPNRSINGQQLRCMARTPESQEPLPSETTELHVNVLPTVISLYDSAGNTSFVNGTSYLIAGVEHEFTCEVPSIDPAASMTWTLGSQGITSNVTKDIVGSDGLINSSSTVTVSPTWSNQGELLQCHAFNKPGYPGLNVSVTLDVKVPPQESSVFLLDLDGFLLGTSVDVDEGSPETFTCVVQDTRPAATIEWFLNGVLESTVSPTDDRSNGLVNTTGTWTLTPETKHHRQVVMCAASTAEASRPFPFVTVSLNVKVLPKEISLFDSSGNYSSKDTAYLIEGVDHQFTCVVPDINPRASFTWTVANQELSSNSSEVTSTSGFLTSTSHVRMAPSWADHGQELLCRATNREGHVGISTFVVLDIKVPPRSSSISLYDASGTSLVNTFVVDQGSPSSLRCEVQGTRPAVVIGWFLNGNLQRTADPHFGEDIGLVNTSDTWSFTPSRANHGQEVRCVASTAESQEPLPSKALNLEVNGPPDLPWIVSNTTMTEGVTTTLTCYADMGFPDDWLLYWSFGNVYDIANLTTVPSASDDRFMFTSALNVTPTRDDNGKTITCTARKDSWTVHPTTTYGPINVHFCPRWVSITNCPLKAIPDSMVSFRCVSESSNPITNLTWLRNGRRKSNPAQPALSNGDYGGLVTTEDFTTAVLTKEDNGALFTCCAAKTTTCPADVCDSCSLNVEYRPYFSEPTATTPSPVREGGDVILSCSADANPMPPGFITWEKVGSPDSLPSVYSDGASNLTLGSISREQAGPYRCRGDNGVPPVVFSNPIDIAVYYEVNITNKAGTYVGAENGEGAVLLCTAEGNPLPLTVWLDPTNEEINNDTDVGRIIQAVTSNGGDDIYGYSVTSILEIKRVTAEGDYGYYTCYSGNGVGRVDMLQIHLNIKVVPSTPYDVSIDEERITANSVTITWRPGAEVGTPQWFYVNYRELGKATDFDPSTRSHRLQGSNEYTVEGLRPYAVYEVEVYAENAHGRSEAVKTVVKTLHCPVFTDPTSLTTNPVDEGDDITLSCSADANPMPTDFITWEKVGSPDSLPSVYSDGNSNLTLSSVRREQAGPYRCRGNNGVPPVIYSRSIDVVVLYEAAITSQADNCVEADDGEAAILTCTVKGNPHPLIRWLSPTRTRMTNHTEPGRITQVDTISGGDIVHGYTVTSTLHIKNVTGIADYGIYLCTCGNGVGRVDTLTFQLTSRVLPGAPMNVSIEEAMNTAMTITVSWTPQNEAAPNIWFHVNYRELATTDDFDPNTRSDRLRGVTSFTLMGLRPYSVYEVEVYAANGNGASEVVKIIGTTAVCNRLVSITGCPYRIVSGGSVSLSCVAESTNPATNLTWLRDNVEQTNYLQPVITDGDYGGRVTTLDLATGALIRTDNGGKYKCCAARPSVCATDVCDTCSLNVEYRPFFSEPAVLTPGPVEEGDDVILSCSADANPMPPDFISWEKVGSPDSLLSVYSDGTSNLTLSSITREQAGPYRCRGNNGVPPDVYSRSIDVIVLYEAAITNRAEYCVEADDGEAAILTCTASGNPLPLIRWLSPTRTRITNNTEPGRITQVDTISGGDVVYGYTVSSILHIKNLTGIGDYGFYVCTCGNGVGRVDTLSIQLTSRVLPAAPANVSIDEAMNTATSVTVSWTPGDEAAPNLWFHVNYRELATTDDFDPTTRSDRLHGVTSFTLMGLRPYSVYEVEVYAANVNGASEAVKILGTTALCTRMVSITGCPYRIVSGGSVSLSCVAESTNPATNLTWLRATVEETGHPEPVITDGDYSGRVTTLDLTTGALIRTDNGGEYKCCAARPSVCTTDVCDTCSLNVEYCPFFSEPVVLTPGPVEEGDDVILSCSADANPMPSDLITWEKVGSPDSLTSIYSDGTSTLTLQSIRREQSGSYRCRGNNGIPPVVFSTPVDIIVHFGVTITNPEANYAEANVGERATLVCTAKGNPYPMMTWLGPTGTRITNQSHPGRITLVETIHGRGGVEGYTVTSTLQINTVSVAEDYGYYVCDCGNGIGMVDTLTILLNSRVEPVPPTNVSIDQDRITANSLTVIWIPGKKVVGPKQWMFVNYRELETTNFSPNTRSGRLYDVSEYRVVGLRADTEYEVEVYAENANGASDVVKIIGKTLPEVGNATPEPLIGITRGTGDATKETSTAIAEVDNTPPEPNAETSAANDFMITSKSQAALGNANPLPLIEITSATSDVIRETRTTLPEVDNTTPEPNDETPADNDVMSKSQSEHEAERRAYVVVEQGYSLLVAGIIVVSIVAFISIMVAVAVFVYHRRSTTNSLEITARKTKLTRASIKYDEESDVVMEKAENLDIPLQVLTSDPGEATREHGSTSN